MYEDTLLNLAGIGVLSLLVAGLAVAGLAAVTADERGGGAPDAEWEFERINETHIRISHAGGDPVAATELVVTVDGYRHDPDWSDTVDESDSVVVRAAAGQIVRIYWVGEERRVRTQLVQWRA